MLTSSMPSAYADGMEPVRDIAEDAASTDPGVRAIVLTGAGERAFSAGADVSAAKAIADPRERARAGRGRRHFRPTWAVEAV